MTGLSFRALDERITSTKISVLIALNQTGERTQIEQRTKQITFVMLLTSIGVLLIAVFSGFSGTLKSYIQLGLSILSAGLMIISYFRGTKTAKLSIAALLVAYGIYNLVIVGVIESELRLTNFVIGVLQVIFALQYVQDANHYEELDAVSADVSQALYDDVLEVLLSSEPNNSNTLIELYSLRQTIRVWLRPSGVVILLTSDKRLYFDVHHSFSITANGDDRGGDKIKVTASIIDKRLTCSMTRHAWLRYTRFAT